MRYSQIATLLALNQVSGVFGQGSGCSAGTVIQAYSDAECTVPKTTFTKTYEYDEIDVEVPISLMLPNNL